MRDVLAKRKFALPTVGECYLISTTSLPYIRASVGAEVDFDC
jgi:hypothetical protein